MNMPPYQIAQGAISDLKAAIYLLLKSAQPEGLRNSEIGRSLGIYMGHVGHEGHIPRTLLAVMEADGTIEQNTETKMWKIK